MHIIISGSFYFGNGNDELVCKIVRLFFFVIIIHFSLHFRFYLILGNEHKHLKSEVLKVVYHS